MQLSKVCFCGSGPDACGAPRATHLFLNVRFAYAKRLLLEACSQKTYKTQRVFYIAPRLLALYKHKGPACARKRKRISARPRTLPLRLRLHLTAATQGRRWNQQARVGPKTGPSQVGAPWEHLVIASLPDQTGSRHICMYRLLQRAGCAGLMTLRSRALS